MKKNFITGLELSPTEIQQLIHVAIAYKNGGALPDFSEKVLTLLFANPSLRTVLSFESGMKKMKGIVNTVHVGNTWKTEYADGAIMNGDTQEHIKDMAKVVSRYSDVIGLRASELITKDSQTKTAETWEALKMDQPIQQLAQHADVPVINMESNMFHPCQALADMMTVYEHLGAWAGKKLTLTWVPHPKALPLATPHSQLLMPALLGMDVTLVHPEGFELDPEVMSVAGQKAHQSGGSLTMVNDQNHALENADVVIAKSWASLSHFGQWENEKVHRAPFKDWTITQEKMDLTDEAIFLHCLPVRRNVEVTDEVLDGPRSRTLDEAENRMWSQMALISYLLTS